ncbi:unnamed protein product, partial [marine sediment metagenome]
MIERQVVAQKLKEKAIEIFIFSYLGKISCSKVKMQRTPLGEKISVYTSRPGLIVGRKGANIMKLTNELKSEFKMDNPQVEVIEIENAVLDAVTVVKNLIGGLERFGPKRFKAMAYRALDGSMKAGARGIEIVISGRGIPGERARTWRFSAGYLKKSGDISANYMDRANEGCNLRSGTIGIKVSILHPTVVLPDEIEFKKTEVEKLEVKEEKAEEKKPEEKKQTKKKETAKKKT